MNGAYLQDKKVVSKLDDQSIVAAVAKAISEASPCGDNARYNSDFEQLEAELAKQESLAAETVDWNRVIELSSKILQQQSKDILVAAYLCYGLLLKQGYSGLALGLNILSTLVDQYWECLFPPAKRMRARQTAFSWLAEKSAIIITDQPPSSEDAQAVLAAAQSLKQLDLALADKMGDQAPLFSDLSRPLKNFQQSMQAEQQAAASKDSTVAPSPDAKAQPAAMAEQGEAAKAPAAVESPATASPARAGRARSAAAGTALSVGELSSEADSKKALRQIQQGSRDIAAFWLQQKLSDPRPYRLNRQALWVSIENPPPDQEGLTQIAPPAAERIRLFETRLSNGDYAELVPELEKTLARSAFWLDGQFMLVKALRALGGEYGKAASCVMHELACFLKRLSGVVALSFSDQTPFASEQTRLWLDTEVLVDDVSTDKAGATPNDAQTLWDEGLQQATARAAAGDSEQAIAIMQQGMSQATSLRAQCYWRCALAQLLLLLGNASAASTLLEQLQQQMDETFVSGFEPQLLAKIYLLLFQAYQKQTGKKQSNDTLQDKMNAAWQKLCWFDPVTALSEKGG